MILVLEPRDHGNIARLSIERTVRQRRCRCPLIRRTDDSVVDEYGIKPVFASELDGIGFVVRHAGSLTDFVYATAPISLVVRGRS